MIRSDVEISEMLENFKASPHVVYEQLLAMRQDHLALFAMQLLSLRTAPLIGPGSSSRVGNPLSDASNRASLLARSMMMMDTSMSAMESNRRAALGFTPQVANDCFGESFNHATSMSSGSGEDQKEKTVLIQPETTTVPPQVTVEVPVAAPPPRKVSIAKPLVTFPTENASFEEDFARAMSTHEVEQSLRQRKQFQRMEIPLKDIFFYQDYVCNQFMDGRFLSSTVEQLRGGQIAPETLPLIECINYKGRWYGMGNRRLSCFHYVFRKTPNKMIPVMALYSSASEHFYPQGDGLTVRLGGGLMLDGRIIFAMKNCTLWNQELN